jgi:DNA-binding LacI/PurR family transcriptional regulator
MTTLSDVAKEANVSKMTVSRVINHPEQVTPELRVMVEKAMESLNYHPNSIAQALVNNRSNVVKFVTLEDIDTTEPYYINLLFGFARGLNSKQYAMQLVTDPDQIEKGRADGYLLLVRVTKTMTCLISWISHLFYLVKITVAMISLIAIIKWEKKWPRSMP